MSREHNDQYYQMARSIMQARAEVIEKLNAGETPVAGPYPLPVFHKGLSRWPIEAFSGKIANYICQHRDQLQRTDLYSDTLHGGLGKLSHFSAITLKDELNLAGALTAIAAYEDPEPVESPPEFITAFDLFSVFIGTAERGYFMPLRRHFVERIAQKLEEISSAPYCVADLYKAVKICTGVKTTMECEAVLNVFNLRQRYGIFEDPQDARLVKFFINLLKEHKYESHDFFGLVADFLPANDVRFIPKCDLKHDTADLIHRHLKILLGDYYDDLIEKNRPAPGGKIRAPGPVSPSTIPDPVQIPVDPVSADVGDIFDEAQRTPLGGRVRNNQQRARVLSRVGLE